MMTRRPLLAAALTAGLAIAGCGGDEPPKTAAPVASKPPTAPAGTVPVACIGKWTSGPTGTLTCSAGGPNKDRVKIGQDTFRLDRICANDPRIGTYTAAGGKTAPIASKPAGPLYCAEFGAVQQLPESCTCIPPAGGDCTPPPDGFVCLATGHVALGGS